MGKLRARLANHQADREAGRRLTDATSAMQMAMSTYRGVLKTGTRQEKRRAASAIDTIRRAMRVLSNVQSVGDRYDVRDPDLVPEADKAPRTPSKRMKAERAE